MGALESNDVILVNGAAGWIGSATVDAFLQEGAFVLGLDRSESVESPRHKRYLGIRLNLGNAADVRPVLDDARERIGVAHPLRHVVGIAGGANPGELKATHFSNVSAGVVADVIQQNFTNQYLFAQAVWPWLSSSTTQDRSIAFTASINGLTGYRQPVYGAMKAALINLAQSLAGLLGPEGVRVNVIAPGATRTRWYENSAPVDTWPKWEAEVSHELSTIASATALRRVAQPSDIADAFVAMSQLRHVTGQCLLVDGGQLLYPRVLDDLG
jgi:NAD(P)-dependent dehydrogenase (short-subunit alcohol dehydrogenase family)